MLFVQFQFHYSQQPAVVLWPALMYFLYCSRWSFGQHYCISCTAVGGPLASTTVFPVLQSVVLWPALLYFLHCSRWSFGQYMVHGTRTWYAVHGTRYTVHGTWYAVHGTRYTVHGTRYAVHGTWYTIHGTRYTVHATRYMTLRFAIPIAVTLQCLQTYKVPHSSSFNPNRASNSFCFVEKPTRVTLWLRNKTD